jgi:hypothetical protein
MHLHRRARPSRPSARRLWDTVELIIEIVILAMIAAFLGLRLYAVLGRRAEHEEEPVPTRFERPDAASAPRAVSPPSRRAATARSRASPRRSSRACAIFPRPTAGSTC